MRLRATTRCSPARRSATPSACCAPSRRQQAALVAQWMNVGFHPRRDEYRQHVDQRRDDRPRAPVRSSRRTTRRPSSAASTMAAAMPSATSPTSRAGTSPASPRSLLLPLVADGDDEPGGAPRRRRRDRDHRRFLFCTRQRCSPGSAPNWSVLAPADGAGASDAIDTALAEDWLALLHAEAVDFTLAGAGWPMPQPATTRRCARCLRTRPRWTAGSRAGVRAASVTMRYRQTAPAASTARAERMRARARG